MEQSFGGELLDAEDEVQHVPTDSGCHQDGHFSID